MTAVARLLSRVWAVLLILRRQRALPGAHAGVQGAPRRGPAAACLDLWASSALAAELGVGGWSVSATRACWAAANDGGLVESLLECLFEDRPASRVMTSSLCRRAASRADFVTRIGWNKLRLRDAQGARLDIMVLPSFGDAAMEHCVAVKVVDRPWYLVLQRLPPRWRNARSNASPASASRAAPKCHDDENPSRDNQIGLRLPVGRAPCLLIR